VCGGVNAGLAFGERKSKLGGIKKRPGSAMLAMLAMLPAATKLLDGKRLSVTCDLQDASGKQGSWSYDR
jgi:hypothetical protein